MSASDSADSSHSSDTEDSSSTDTSSYLPLIVLNPVNMSLKLHQELQPVVQIVKTLSRIGSHICHGKYS